MNSEDRLVKIEHIDINEALRYLGYGDNEPDRETRELLLLCKKQLLDAIDAKFIYKVFEIKDGQLVGCDFRLEGQAIQKHLENCQKAVLMCATLSAGVDNLIRRKQITSMAEATVIDSMASAAVEQVCNEAEKVIMKSFDGFQHTWRFGLGYDDFPLSGQKQFLNVLDAQKRVGVCVNSSMLLTPTKSVTCVIGLGHNLKTEKTSSCEICSIKDKCKYRKDGKNCGR